MSIYNASDIIKNRTLEEYSTKASSEVRCIPIVIVSSMSATCWKQIKSVCHITERLLVYKMNYLDSNIINSKRMYSVIYYYIYSAHSKGKMTDHTWITNL